MKGLVHGRREDAVTIMNEKAIRAIQGKAISELLDRPCCRGVVGEIPVHDLACADVEDDEDVQPLKGGGHHDEEVAGQLSRPTTALLCAEYNSRVHPSLSDLKLIFYFV